MPSPASGWWSAGTKVSRSAARCSVSEALPGMVDQRLDALDRVRRFLGQVLRQCAAPRSRPAPAAPRGSRCRSAPAARHRPACHPSSFHWRAGAAAVRASSYEPPPSGVRPTSHIGHDELGGAGRHHEVAGQHQREARAGGEAFHGGNDRLGERVQRLDPAVEVSMLFALHLGRLERLPSSPVRCASPAPVPSAPVTSCADRGPIPRTRTPQRFWLAQQIYGLRVAPPGARWIMACSRRARAWATWRHQTTKKKKTQAETP